jgi:hypothetical protein
LFDPQEKVWRIWWTSSRYPGVLTRRSSAGFSDGVGRFYCDDVINGTPVKGAFRMVGHHHRHSEVEPGVLLRRGETWKANWYNWFTRLSH